MRRPSWACMPTNRLPAGELSPGCALASKPTSLVPELPP